MERSPIYATVDFDKPGDSGGYTGALKYVFGPQSFARLAAAYSSPTTATDGTDQETSGRARRHAAAALLSGIDLVHASPRGPPL